MLIDFFTIVSLGFGLGMLHALDADHVMAVSTMSNQKTGFLKTLKFCSHWAIGHGGMLLLCGALLFGLGLAIPEPIQQYAEASIGVFLIVLGGICLYQFKQEKIKLKLHRHGDIEHIHWHDESHPTEHSPENINDRHLPVMVGGVHGLAGSAPALALIPSVAHGEFAISLIYLSVFSIGVLLSMAIFGLGFGWSQEFLKNKYHSLYQISRQVIAGGSILFGSFWLYQAV